MKRYQDPAIRARARQLGGRVALAVREAKRAEAQHRASRTLHEHTRAHRLGRCECWLPQRVQSRPQRQRGQACPWPGKVAYASPQEAARVLGKHARWRRWRQGLNIYPCGDHYHAARPGHDLAYALDASKLAAALVVPEQAVARCPLRRDRIPAPAGDSSGRGANHLAGGRRHAPQCQAG